jgi:hypothetical protein
MTAIVTRVTMYAGEKIDTGSIVAGTACRRHPSLEATLVQAAA